MVEGEGFRVRRILMSWGKGAQGARSAAGFWGQTV